MLYLYINFLNNQERLEKMKRLERKVYTKIKNLKEKLIKKAIKSGIYENFGQEEISTLSYMFSEFQYGSAEERYAWKLIENFNNWCMNFDDNTLKYLSVNKLKKKHSML